MSRSYLTAVFELHPSIRKAAAMERVRSLYESAFWSVMECAEADAIAAVEIEDKKDRAAETARIKAMAFQTARSHGLCEPLCQGLSRDVDQSVTSYIELCRTGQDASWPAPVPDIDVGNVLDDLALSTTKDDEDAARDLWFRVEKQKIRPMTIARSRDARIVRIGENGRIGVSLNILTSIQSSRKANIHSGVDASSGEETKAMSSATRLVMPVSCSKWTENKFLSGNATLRSSIIYRRGDRWFMHAQFEMKAPEIETKSFIGIDRGIVNTLAAAVVRHDGSIVQTPAVTGSDIGALIQEADRKAASARSRGARTLPRYRNAADNILHQIANSVVALAKEHRSTVVMENLSGLKQVMVTKRQKGSRKNPWQRVLKRAQFGKLETMLDYKLQAAGLPKPIYVPAGGTSMTCSCCGHQHKGNRQSRDIFRCVECGFTADAYINAAVQIARRGTMKVKKGDKLVELHKNMVDGLRSRDDGGLGPLLEATGKGLVAARASGTAPDECFGTDNADLGQEVTVSNQNVGDRVFSERVGAISGYENLQLSLFGNEFPATGSGVPEIAGVTATISIISPVPVAFGSS